MSDRELIRMDNDLCRAEERITTLLAVIEQCEVALGSYGDAICEFEVFMALGGKVTEGLKKAAALHNDAFAAIKKVKESK